MCLYFGNCDYINPCLESAPSKKKTRSKDIIVVAEAIFAFDSENIDLCFGALMTVFALDFDEVLGGEVPAALHQELDHGHVWLFYRFFTEWALLIGDSERLKAVSMHLMAAP